MMTRKRKVLVEDAVHTDPDSGSQYFIAEANTNEMSGLKRGWMPGYIFQDAKSNSPKIKCFLVLFRLASLFERKKKSLFYRALYMLTDSMYRLFSDLFAGIELPAGTPVGRNLTIHHGYGIVIGKGACLKDNVILRQGVTIGNYVDRAGRVIGEPVIESGVEFGAGACALGDIRIGEGAFIGANCVVFKDVLARERVYPGRCVVSSPISSPTPAREGQMS